MAVLLISLLVLATGCPRKGAKTIRGDRIDFSRAISDSMKEQMLLNVVKMRYLDMPTFVEVGQIINSYDFQAPGSVSASIGPKTFSLGGSGGTANRPTITYTPLNSNQFVRGLMTPLPPEVVFFAAGSGYAADLIILTTASSINGLRNDTISDDEHYDGDSEFFRVAELFRDLQKAEAMSLVMKVGSDKEYVPVLAFDPENRTERTKDSIDELKTLLKLDPSANEFRLIFGNRAPDKSEIAIRTRSLIQAIGSLAMQVDVPPEDAEQAFKSSTRSRSKGSGLSTGLFKVTASAKRPSNAFVSVKYRDHWFTIDDRDLKSKRVFSIVLLLFSLGESKAGENAPIFTIPVR
ncbi:MAG: hypothetical protein QUS14_16635 [Pyrinomonadaceae bacterium]|nr:hypothetical protein [Pyrinomonadaceae bacterium]